MARIARAVAPGYPHHVTQRGNYQQNIFRDDEDYRRYKSWLEEYSRREGLRIWAYRLTPGRPWPRKDWFKRSLSPVTPFFSHCEERKRRGNLLDKGVKRVASPLPICYIDMSHKENRPLYLCLKIFLMRKRMSCATMSEAGDLSAVNVLWKR